jgi:pilus assembly protein CpaC
MFGRIRSQAKHRRARLAAGILFALVFLAGYSNPFIFLGANAQAPEAVEHVVIPVNKSVTLQMPQPFASAVVDAAEIAVARALTDRKLYIQAKKIGTTNVSVYDESMRIVKIVDVEVGVDTGNLQSKIRAALGINTIRVTNDYGRIVLSGTVMDAVAADRAVSLAKAWQAGADVGQQGGAGDQQGGAGNQTTPSVINLLNVASPQQVMLKVRFLEVDRNAGRQLGVNWNAVNGSGTRGVTLGQGGLTTQPPALGGTANATTTTSNNGTTTTNTTCQPSGICPPFGSGLFQAVGTLVGTGGGTPYGVILAEIVNKGVQIDSLITALETKGLLQRLAEPNLVALSGDTASFQAGGSIPVPTAVTSGLGVANPTITFEPYGVLLNFRPTVLANGIINISIAPKVSELDFTNAVSISGTTIPALTVRSATTTVELRDGQSFAIAGLLAADNLRNVSGLPWVDSLPVLGALFRSSAYQKNETDLVIIVTPSLVQPAAPGAHLATPFDNTVPSNDTDFFLFGQLEQRKKYTDYVTTGGDIQGPYGYMLGILQQQQDQPGPHK